MKIKNAILKLLIAVVAIVVAIGPCTSFAKSTSSSKTLALSYFRYIYSATDSSYTQYNGYGYNITGSNHKPIFQIYETDSNSSVLSTNYYCLNATKGETWLSQTTGTTVTYDTSFDLDDESDIEELKDEATVYSDIANSNYLYEILWILDNMYVPDTEATDDENYQSKLDLLAQAGIVYKVVGTAGDDVYGFAYEQQTGYSDYSQGTRTFFGTDGYNYYDTSDKYQMVVITDDIVEAAQQAAIWYFTNYLEGDQDSSYDVAYDSTEGLKLRLVYSDGKTNTTSSTWESLTEYEVETYSSGDYAEIGAWEEEQAAILCAYLIEGAKANASTYTENTGTPLSISPSSADYETQNINGTYYYIVGPITISEDYDTTYNLDDTIYVNGNTSTGAYLSDSTGTATGKTVQESVGSAFYVAVPVSSVSSSNSIQISFTGTYTTNEKTLWISSTGEEQPIVEVGPVEEPIELSVTTTIEGEFDLALRKAIIEITDSSGNTKYIYNEAGSTATRSINYVATDIAENGTATYNHRKDPVVVETGDIVTYSITIYNEGDMAGYASTIVDELPSGLQLAGYAANGTTTGTYTSGDIKYSYVYEPSTNAITITNESKNELAAYDGGDTLSSETIEIECEVVATNSTTTNTYLTNIAYISGEYNTETGEEVTTDRDSSTNNSPSATKETTGDSYSGYHGGDNNNGDNSKNVYDDTNNSDYIPGREDDDDFEIIVLPQAEFDLALQKYISKIYSSDGSTSTDGRSAPTIDTTNLASGNATTATYTQDKTAITVENGDYVIYTLTVYNEGDVDGYVNKITDNIPEGLEFVYIPEDSSDGATVRIVDSEGNYEDITVSEEIYELIAANNSYWSIDQDTSGSLLTDTYNDETTISITCDVESYLGGTNKLLSAYDADSDTNHDGSNLSTVSVTVLLRVSDSAEAGVTIRNEAAITEAEDEDGNIQDIGDLEDRDSHTDEWPGKDGDKKYEDDEDYDNIILVEENPDLALTKFIVAVSDDLSIDDGEWLTEDTTSTDAGSSSNPYIRATKVDTTELRDNEDCHDATYTLVKDPLTVPAQSYVLYNIRIYNEGDTNVYAGEVTDYLPTYLDFVECDFNTNYGWTVDSDGKTIRTSYLAYVEGSTTNLLQAFDKETDDGAGSGLDYRDLQVLCRINDEAPTNTNIVNTAEITEYQDEDGEDLPEDIDSEPDNINDHEESEDDEDYEVVLVQTFDLSLLKYVTKVYVTEDGVTETIETGNVGDENDTIPKVEINRKKVDTTVVKFEFTIKITNEGDIAGYATEITDYVPEGLKFYAEDNTGWTDEGDNVISTKLLEDTLLQPGESATVTVVLRWINGSDNMGLKTNTAEISEDYNEYGIPDRDSTPDNKVEGEDDIDDASVILSVSTGIGKAMTYIGAATLILIVLGTGIVAIKKYVL